MQLYLFNSFVESFHITLMLALTVNPSTYFAYQNGLEVLILLYPFPFLFHLKEIVTQKWCKALQH